jgi:hypothetical protein
MGMKDRKVYFLSFIQCCDMHIKCERNPKLRPVALDYTRKSLGITSYNSGYAVP